MLDEEVWGALGVPGQSRDVIQQQIWQTMSSFVQEQVWGGITYVCDGQVSLYFGPYNVVWSTEAVRYITGKMLRLINGQR